MLVFALQTLRVLFNFKAVCKNLRDEELEGDALLKAVFNAISVYYNYTGVAKCFDINQQATKDLGDKGWNFQVCNFSI